MGLQGCGGAVVWAVVGLVAWPAPGGVGRGPGAVLVLTLAGAPTRCLPPLRSFSPQGMRDEQLDRLARLLRLGRIWAVNVGENFGTSQEVRLLA